VAGHCPAIFVALRVLITKAFNRREHRDSLEIAEKIRKVYAKEKPSFFAVDLSANSTAVLCDLCG
jgi:phosphoheptose isomerase